MSTTPAFNRAALSRPDFEALFDMVPISVWLEDFSGVKSIWDRLRAEGVTDFRTRLEEDASLV